MINNVGSPVPQAPFGPDNLERLDVKRAHDYLFLCFLIEKMKNRLSTDGAAELNNMLQESAGLSKEQAFAFIKDALNAGFIGVSKSGSCRQLHVVSENFNVLRDNFNYLIPEIHAGIESQTWKLRSGLRFILDEDEQSILKKFIDMNRVRAGASETVDGFKDISDPVVNTKKDVVVAKKAATTSVLIPSMQEDFSELVGDSLTEFFKLHEDKNFTLMIIKGGSSVSCSFKDVSVAENKMSMMWK